jgi:sugar phosphate isomerase/epimerase
MGQKLTNNRRHLTFPVQVDLDVEEILDGLRRIDYDYLMEEMVARKLIEPSEVSASRKQTSSTLEEYYLEALDKLKFRFMSLESKDINYIIELAKKS